MAATLTSYLAHIANGQTTSSETAQTNGGLSIAGNGLERIYMPAAFTGTTLTFQESFDDSASSYLPLYDATGAAYAVTVAAGHATILDPSVFVAANFIKIVSSASEGAARVVTLIGRPY